MARAGHGEDHHAAGLQDAAELRRDDRREDVGQHVGAFRRAGDVEQARDRKVDALVPAGRRPDRKLGNVDARRAAIC